MSSPVSSDEYRILVEQSPIMIWRANAEAACDYFNERWLEFTGRSLLQEVGDGWASGVHADDLERCLRTYREAFARRLVFEMEYRLRRHDGEYRWIIDRGGPIIDAAGSFVGYIGSCIDVTERVLAQEALARAHASELRTLERLLPICAWCRKIRDDDGNWEVLESYLSKHSATTVTHGLCEDCSRNLHAADAG